MKKVINYVPRTVLGYAIKLRNNCIASNRVIIAESVNPEDAQFLKNNRVPLARFAKRNDCKVFFDEKNNTTNVSVCMPRFHHFIDGVRKMYGHIETAVLPTDIKTKEKPLNQVRTILTDLINQHSDEPKVVYHYKPKESSAHCKGPCG